MIPVVMRVATAVAPQIATANSAAAGTKTVFTVPGGVPAAIAAASNPEGFTGFRKRFRPRQADIVERPVIELGKAVAGSVSLMPCPDDDKDVPSQLATKGRDAGGMGRRQGLVETRGRHLKPRFRNIDCMSILI
jgi:hypothetical protein